MNLKLLGTGAADGIPALCSDSPVSRWAREYGGKDVRTRAAALLDGEIKLDLGPDTLAQLQRQGLDCADWTSLIFTHSDEDHLTVSELQYFLQPFNSHPFLAFPIYGNASVLQKISERYPGWPIELVETHAFEKYSIAGYEFTPVRAMHGVTEEAHNLVFRKDGKTLVYATDTGIWPEETFEYFQGAKIDLLVIECTEGLRNSEYKGHLDANELLSVLSRLRSSEGIAESAKIVTTHHKHTGGRHCALVKFLSPHGIDVGYDGMDIAV